MPWKIPAAQAAFKFSVNGVGLPVAQVERWGSGTWIRCCPLCGNLHETLKGQTEGVHTPRCLAREWNTAAYKAWIASHPEASQYRQVQLEYKPLAIAPYVAPVKPGKAAKKSAAPRKRGQRSQPPKPAPVAAP
jgi:hypothetical protein